MAIRSDFTIDSVGLIEWQGIPVEPRDLPEDTDLLDQFDFLVAAYKRYPRVLLIDLVIVVNIAAISWAFGFVLGDTHVGAGLGLIGWMVLAFGFLPGRTTRSAVVKQLDENGRPYWDHQKWFKRDYIQYPDSPQFYFPSGKQLWLDATGDNVKIIEPWEGKDPETDKTSADIIGQESLNQSAKTLAMYRAKTSLIGKYGVQLAILGVAFLALFLAANRTQTLFIGTP